MQQTPRKIGLGGLWNALLERPRSLLIGAWLTIFPALFLIPFFSMMHALNPKELDHQKIRAEGRETQGEVIRITRVSNMSINGVNPRRVVFRYEDQGKDREAAMDTMSIDTVSRWDAGRKITIKTLNGEATVPELDPVDFPFVIFYMMPFIFAAIGLPFLAYAVTGAVKKKRVLEHGQPRKARLLSMTPLQSYGAWFLKTQFETQYAYNDEDGREVFGKSFTTDLQLLNDKKKGDEIDILVSCFGKGGTQVIDSRTAGILRG